RRPGAALGAERGHHGGRRQPGEQQQFHVPRVPLHRSARRAHPLRRVELRRRRHLLGVEEHPLRHRHLAAQHLTVALPAMRRLLLLSPLVFTACAARNYTYYLIEPPTQKHATLKEDGTTLRPFQFGSTTVMKVRWNDGSM